MHFEMEELLPIVGRLVERYTGMDSTSVSYEKAEQLMEAVLYCIRETELETPWAVADIQGTSARQIYEAGKGAVEKKVKKALKLYHELLPEFSSSLLYHMQGPSKHDGKMIEDRTSYKTPVKTGNPSPHYGYSPGNQSLSLLLWGW